MLKYKKPSHPQIDKEQEIKLFSLYQRTKDPKIKAEIVSQYSGLVFHYAKKISHKKYQYEDVVQEGFLGLNSAIDKFDVNKKCRFLRYASYWIKAQMFSFVYDNHMLVNVPASANFLKGFWKMRQMGDLNNKELSERLNLSLDNVEILQNILNNPERSLDYKSKDDDSDYYNKIAFQKALSNASITTYEEAFVEHQERFYKLNVINNQLKYLKDKEKDVILEYYMNDKTLDEIGRKHNVTRQRIEQIQKLAVNKIKENIERVGQ